MRDPLSNLGSEHDTFISVDLRLQCLAFSNEDAGQIALHSLGCSTLSKFKVLVHKCADDDCHGHNAVCTGTTPMNTLSMTTESMSA